MSAHGSGFHVCVPMPVIRRLLRAVVPSCAGGVSSGTCTEKHFWKEVSTRKV